MNFDQQFNLRKRHPFAKYYLLANEIQSAITRLTHSCSIDISYGDSTGQKLDIFPAKQTNSPVFVFIHGGYFRALDKKQYSFIANPFIKAGCTTVLVNYDLAPSVSVEQIIEQNIKAYQWIYQNIKQYNGDNSNIVICGHSVGAFLTAKIIEHNWPTQIQQSIKGAALLSGLYDLNQLKQSFLNQWLKLTDNDANQLNPTLQNSECFPPLVIAVGENETQVFIQQSQNYHQQLPTKTTLHQIMLMKNHNHYTVARQLGKVDSDLTKAILKMF